MVLSNKSVSEFQEIYRSEFGKEISKEEAYEQGTKLVRLMRILYKSPSEENMLQLISQTV